MWTYDEIERDWLQGGRIAVDKQEIVSSFDRVEAVLGKEWIRRVRHPHDGVVHSGLVPTLDVTIMGQQLQALERAEGQKEELIRKLLGGDESAEAELTALYLLHQCGPDAMELYPSVGDGVADLRLRKTGELWTYVEVTQPDWSEAKERADTVMNSIISLLRSIKRCFALEVFLRREPSATEIGLLLDQIPGFCSLEGPRREDLDDGLGYLVLNATTPGVIATEQAEGQSRIGMAQVISGGDEPRRHISVRMIFGDDRAEAVLRKEARQLPDDSPGLIVTAMGRSPGGFRVWQPIICRRFQPNIHTRVGGLCMYSGGLLATEYGEAWLPATKVIVNPNARFKLPSWVADGLTALGRDYEKYAGAP